jgi:hypothetical protein
MNNDLDVNGGGATDEREMLRQSIENDKAELRDAVDDLNSAVHSRLAIRERIASRPLPWLAGAFLLGFWLSRGSR